MNYEQHLRLAEHLSTILDEQFKIGPWKFGLDPIIGLVPVAGDILPLLVSIYTVWIGRQIGAPESLQQKLVANAIIDLVLGMIPLVGDISDFVWKANSRNIRLLRSHLSQRPLEGEIIAEDHLATQI